MIESLRSLLYPLGFVANLLFGGRFLVQWIQSEKKGESTVSRLFWRLSFIANLSMAIHAFIQLQFPICLIQALNTVIGWRNLNLMSQKVRHFRTTLLVMATTAIGVSLLFFMQGSHEWMRPPTLPWTGTHATHASLGWHIAGFFGILLFASRYWIQWWFAEKHQKSFLGKSFWWVSCIGALFSLAYAIRLIDPVNILGFSIGLIPYIRNLMLIRKKTLSQPSPASSSLFIFAGEQSGDVLGGNLVRALKNASPSLQLFGVGGSEMEKAGMEIIHPMERFQVMGVTDVLKALPRLAADFKKIKREILSKQPAGVVLIDYADFNMRLADALRKAGYRGKIIHYVCPSVWAWRKNRVKKLAKTLDHLLSILPFEKTCFEKTTLPVTYVGHPLVAAIDKHTYDPSWNLSKPVIAIFPGSRRHEIELNLPVQLAAFKPFAHTHTLAISIARPTLEPLIRSFAGADALLVPADKRYELMRAASGALATSGTIILELGLHSVPTVATYQMTPFNYFLARHLLRIRLPFYTLVNIICKKEVYPEIFPIFTQRSLSSNAIAEALNRLLENPEPCHHACNSLRTILQNHDASAKAAATILEELV